MRASSRIKIEVFCKTLVSGEKHLLACSIERAIDLINNGESLCSLRKHI